MTHMFPGQTAIKKKWQALGSKILLITDESTENRNEQWVKILWPSPYYSSLFKWNQQTL